MMIACLILFLPLVIIFGQSRRYTQIVDRAVAISSASKSILSDKIANWNAIGASHTFKEDQISSLPDGDIYTEYGVQTLTTRFYSNGNVKLSVKLFQTHFASEAYGLATFIRNSLSREFQVFNKSHFLLVIIGERGNTEMHKSLLNNLKANIICEDEGLPSLVFKLPKDQKLDNTDKYIIGPIGLGRIKEFAALKGSVSFTGGTQAVIANYQNDNRYMSLAIFEYHTPQLASDGYSNIQRHLKTLSLSEKNSHILKRVGNYIILGTNIQDATSAERIIAGIKYSPNIYWEGNKISNIPTQFRPTDPLVFEEATQTANILIRTFYWIGIMILAAIVIGFITGGYIFYWNHNRQHKFGIDNTLSNANKTVRLNLYNYTTKPVDDSISLIVKRLDKDNRQKNGDHN